ncbi:MAG: YceD family protein, partial [Sediminibacterium sp.]
MGHNRTFEIPFVGLKPGEHEFEYQIEDKFFLDYGPQEFDNCHTKVKLVLEKNQGFMQLRFDVDGQVDTICDRCGNPLTVQLWDEFNLIVKLVDNPDTMNSQEEDADIFYIDRNESH